MKNKFVIIGISIAVFFILLIIAILVTMPSEEERNAVYYEQIKEDFYSNVDDRGYYLEDNYLTIYLGRLTGTGKIVINSITNDNGTFKVSINTSYDTSKTNLRQTPSLKVKLYEKPNSILIKDNHNEVYNLIDPNNTKINVSCDAGMYYDKDTKKCTTCPENSYSAKGDNVCNSCPDKLCAPKGSKSSKSCGKC